MPLWVMGVGQRVQGECNEGRARGLLEDPCMASDVRLVKQGLQGPYNRGGPCDAVMVTSPTSGYHRQPLGSSAVAMDLWNE